MTDQVRINDVNTATGSLIIYKTKQMHLDGVGGKKIVPCESKHSEKKIYENLHYSICMKNNLTCYQKNRNDNKKMKKFFAFFAWF